ncbi:alpha-amylase [Sandaracinomonas limnophila]|uniref:Alpha-amylase n=1 Tax=Sandaracinomonas limnophila TaxID=1862386 RepID=A0A437PRD4_9BACT|nr:alpha-amylase family glycosyl hydrolase [Sandaracinomonas limnophila]RVU24790.1 alpha-amylase [Sandaracinomonas limnophila]
MYNITLTQHLQGLAKKFKLGKTANDQQFLTHFIANIDEIQAIFHMIYGQHPNYSTFFEQLLESIFETHAARSKALKERDEEKAKQGFWYLSNQLMGMSLYVDRFAGSLKGMKSKLDYLENLGVNYLHLMPIFESPEGESDGGYAVSDFRKVDKRFGSNKDLIDLQKELQAKNMYLMIDIVLNHTSHHHEWAKKAKAGNKEYQDYFYFYDDRKIPDQMDETMPEIFPESSPGSFTYIPEADKWAMTVFHHYQWDLNYTNPKVFLEMLSNVFHYGNLGVDVLRIDAPAFIWKEMGTTCQNLPKAHKLLQLIKLCTEVATPGMALLGEAIVAPAQIMEYFGTGRFVNHECDVAYNATQMAVQWDALATGDTRIMLAAQQELQKKPLGGTWITYTRCHDDIGLGYDDYMIEQAGFTPYLHRHYLKNYYGGIQTDSPAAGALFAVNPKTNDARISGSLASLCGLEKAKADKDSKKIQESIQKIILMQAQSFLLGGIPIIFYGDEVGYENDYSYLKDAGKSYDNRWMHRPIIDWKKNALAEKEGTFENQIFSATQKLIQIRKQFEAFGDYKNIEWLHSHNKSVVGYKRTLRKETFICLFNYSNQDQGLTYYVFEENGEKPKKVKDLWTNKNITISYDHDHLNFKPYQFYIFKL